MTTTVEAELRAAPELVWEALMTASDYPRWIVGAQAFRGESDDWPAPGSRFHHAVGIGPVRLRDTTSLLEVDDGRRVALEARARPTGRARVEIELTPAADGHTRVSMSERAISGPGRLVPAALHDPVIRLRNREALRRLARLVEPRVAA